MTQDQQNRLQAVLTAAFDKGDLEQMATTRLVFKQNRGTDQIGIRLADDVNFDQEKSEVAYQIVRRACDLGHGITLFRVVADLRPSRPDVIALAADLGVNLGPVRDAVIVFNDRFQARQKLFGYLNAFKQLHDLLHDLQEFRPQIEAAAAAARRPAADRPDPAAVIDPLQLWVVQARASAGAAASPRNKWVDRFEKAVGDLTTELGREVADLTRLDRAVEVLAHLPADEQKGLNERLVDCALRLETDDLIALMNDILDRLGAGGAGAAGAAGLRPDVAEFRAQCDRVAGLIREHNLCQEVDGALREADGLGHVTPDGLSQWAEIRGWLNELRAARPGVLQAARPADSADQFETAARDKDQRRADQAFARLRERFNDLFLHTDKALLEVTKDLLVAARVLNAALQRYLT